jgi:hypothetical protein
MAQRKSSSSVPATATPPASDARFARIARRLLADRRVSQARMFGATGLQQNGKYFAMCYRGTLVVKLPAPRVADLVAGGKGQPFDPGHGRVMKEWVAIPPDQGRLWGRIAAEARAYVMREG